jgi:hypothetical protein
MLWSTQESCRMSLMQAIIELDAIDRRLLRALQANGRMTSDRCAGSSGSRRLA